MTFVRVPVSWAWTVWDLVLATIVAAIAVQYRGADVVLGLAMAIAIVFRRRAPERVFAVVAALALIQLFIGEAPAGYDLAVMIALLSVVSHAARRWTWYLAGAVTGAGWLLIAVPQYLAEGWWSYLFIAHVVLLVVMVAVFLVGLAVRLNRDARRALADRVAIAERERDYLARLAVVDERTVIARELHDIVAHGLAVMIAQADGASYAVETNASRARDAMRTVAGTGRDALDDMHRIVAVLRGSDPPQAGTDDQSPIHADQLDTVVERARVAGLDVTLRIDGDPAALSAAGGLTVLRVVQEGLTNVLRHAGPGAVVQVTLQVADGRAVLDIQDDGGATPAVAPVAAGGGGHGLIGMRERIAVHGGEITAGPRPGRGWQIAATIPDRVAR